MFLSTHLPKFQGSYVCIVLCSLGPEKPGYSVPMVLSNQGPKEQMSYFPRYVSSQGPMFPGTGETRVPSVHCPK